MKSEATSCQQTLPRQLQLPVTFTSRLIRSLLGRKSALTRWLSLSSGLLELLLSSCRLLCAHDTQLYNLMLLYFEVQGDTTGHEHCEHQSTQTHGCQSLHDAMLIDMSLSQEQPGKADALPSNHQGKPMPVKRVHSQPPARKGYEAISLHLAKRACWGMAGPTETDRIFLGEQLTILPDCFNSQVSSRLSQACNRLS